MLGGLFSLHESGFEGGKSLAQLHKSFAVMVYATAMGSGDCGGRSLIGFPATTNANKVLTIKFASAKSFALLEKNGLGKSRAVSNKKPEPFQDSGSNSLTWLAPILEAAEAGNRLLIKECAPDILDTMDALVLHLADIPQSPR